MLLLTTAVLLQVSPARLPCPGQDSSSFLYVGQEILRGAVPYRDAWEPKGPVILFINALGLALGGGSVWGVWALQLASVSAAALAGYALMRRIFGQVSATVASAMWIICLAGVLETGNFTEEYGLLFQFLAIYVFVLCWERGWSLRRTFALGALGGLAFFLRQNLIGIQAAVVVTIIVQAAATRMFADAGRKLLGMLAGFAAVSGAFVGYFLAKGALAQFWDCTFAYGLVYAGVEGRPGNRLQALWTGLTWVSGTSVMACAAWVAAGITERQGWKRLFHAKSSCPAREALLLLLFVALPVELYLGTLTGREYMHYFLAWLPVLSLLSAYGISLVVRRANEPIALLMLVAALSPVFVPQVSGLAAQTIDTIRPAASSVAAVPCTPVMVADYIKERTSEDEYVLGLGFGGQMNVMCERRSPSRFFFPAGLYTAGYATKSHVQEYYRDILRHKPRFVIDYSPSDPNLSAWPAGMGIRQQFSTWQAPPEMQHVIEYLRRNYALRFSVGGTWLVYERR